MPESEHFFTDTRKELETYLENRVLLLKMQMTEKTGRLVGRLVVLLVLVILIVVTLFFASLMAAYYLSDVTDSLMTGFGIVAGGYLLVLILVWLFRNKLGRSVTDTVIQILLKER
ncbi:MAG: phage holin family protein [Sediminibacterium sp.]|nr:phage holin family protein [Sediminibacterium sp.]